ncbi:sterol regulatory element-binding protein cleavage-activating protein-like [Limulus polyphemus]|uniref:Sterol regulatory element-binding protein cleavage-activating protein-like n=1 Tax=Limulus polyphemus TaxID=6850 RepID=A0ABM1RUM6_LIMPO|nr:sterol regulatory element-binding protein cleavage-activating protein-like [Limulus polyphemus]
MIISSCLAGDIRVWDSLSGECLTTIIRSSPIVNKSESGTHIRGSGSFSSDSTYGSSPTSETGDYFSVQSTYRPPGFLRKMVDSASRFVTSQPSSQDDHSAGGFFFHSMKHGYDFSRAFKTKDVKLLGRDRLIDTWKCHKRNQSDGNELDEEIQITAEETSKNNGTTHHSPLSYQPLWCMDCQGGWLVLGCGGGRIEVWDALAGVLRTVYEDSQLGVTSLQMIGRRLVVARLNGVLEFLQLTASSQHEGEREPSPNTEESGEEEVVCVWLQGLRAHTQPITTLVVEGGHVVSGSLDCLIKVFKWDSAVCVYTLHGHRGGITVLQVDSVSTKCSCVYLLFLRTS